MQIIAFTTKPFAENDATVRTSINNGGRRCFLRALDKTAKAAADPFRQASSKAAGDGRDDIH
ncbi:hypothetical protein HT585_14510 [Ensifer sp. HO-A22]|uniref:Uncharacterized protein n=1 Tax=Ensifer oleiphilus TaxID=2742698 RepID=A0A7Y6Q6V6_9HYPH|nr:hypothetical protein [Ensifer oleiphilus]NVD40076.1 hypothetical protein [Ensifer oleiphilus]